MIIDYHLCTHYTVRGSDLAVTETLYVIFEICKSVAKYKPRLLLKFNIVEAKVVIKAYNIVITFYQTIHLK